MSITTLKPVFDPADQFGKVSGNISDENLNILRSCGIESADACHVIFDKNYLVIRVPSGSIAIIPELEDHGLKFELYPASDMIRDDFIKANMAQLAYSEYLFFREKDEVTKKTFASEYFNIHEKLYNYYHKVTGGIFRESFDGEYRSVYADLPEGNWCFKQRYDQDTKKLTDISIEFSRNQDNLTPTFDIPPSFIYSAYDCLYKNEFNRITNRTPLVNIQRNSIASVLSEWPINETYEQVIQRLKTDYDDNNDGIIIPYEEYDGLSGRELAKSIARNVQSTLTMLYSSFGIDFDPRGQALIHSIPISTIQKLPESFEALGLAMRDGDPQTISDRFLSLERLLAPNPVVRNTESGPANWP